MKRYRIYQMPSTAENIERAAGSHPFYRATTQHLLVYTNKRKPAEGTLVRDVMQLPSSDRGWVAACNILIADEAMRKHPDTQAGMMKFLTDLEKELEKEQILLKEA